ncbi:fibronectin type III domain-containing protein [Microbacterium lacus]|uniref:fibronectin type III domain-containing protein n=1 Tax=Microbacterium lacus TaxID=415217 RepID=UPI0012FE049D|nr:fibronectin type III domain-containing protein [Microbacterium lacus]
MGAQGAMVNSQYAIEIHTMIAGQNYGANQSTGYFEARLVKTTGTNYTGYYSGTGGASWEAWAGGGYWAGTTRYDFRGQGAGFYVVLGSDYFVMNHDANGNLNYSYSARASMPNPPGGSATTPTGTDAVARIPKAPDAPTMVALDQITATSMRARFAGNGDGGGGISGWQLQYSSHPAFADGGVVIGSSGTSILNALTPATDYFVRARGLNAYGAGPWSAPISARTLSGARLGRGGSFPGVEVYVGKGGSFVLAEVLVGKSGSFVHAE